MSVRAVLLDKDQTYRSFVNSDKFQSEVDGLPDVVVAQQCPWPRSGNVKLKLSVATDAESRLTGTEFLLRLCEAGFRGVGCVVVSNTSEPGVAAGARGVCYGAGVDGLVCSAGAETSAVDCLQRALRTHLAGR